MRQQRQGRPWICTADRGRRRQRWGIGGEGGCEVVRWWWEVHHSSEWWLSSSLLTLALDSLSSSEESSFSWFSSRKAFKRALDRSISSSVRASKVASRWEWVPLSRSNSWSCKSSMYLIASKMMSNLDTCSLRLMEGRMVLSRLNSALVFLK